VRNPVRASGRPQIPPKADSGGEGPVGTRFRGAVGPGAVPETVAALRARGGEKIVLIVVTDADSHSVAERRDLVIKHLEAVGGTRPAPEEPVFWVVPKWEIETWMGYLREGTFDEQKKDNPKVYGGRESECRPEVEKLIRMCREKNLVPPPPASLLDACVEYERLLKYLG